MPLDECHCCQCWPRSLVFAPKYVTYGGRDKMATIFQTTFSNALTHWHLGEGNVTGIVLDITHCKVFGNYIVESTTTSPTGQWVNPLCPSDVIWRQGSRSTLAQVMACCLTATSHYLNQCWLMISEGLWHSSDSNFTEDIYRWNEFEIY